MIEFKLINGKEGYEITKDIRKEYLKTGEMDEHDCGAVHIAGFERGKIICSGRMYCKDNIRCVIDNVIVDNENRKQYVGDTILRALEDKAVQMARAVIEVRPDEASRAFFAAEGYAGEDKMVKDLTAVRGCRGCGGGSIK